MTLSLFSPVSALAVDIDDGLVGLLDRAPQQALGELFRVLVRKAKISPRSARTTIIRYRDTYPIVETSSGVFLSATDLAVDHQISIWDAVMFAAAAEAGCRLLLSEDLQEGFTWGGVTVVNPFAAIVHPLLARRNSLWSSVGSVSS